MYQPRVWSLNLSTDYGVTINSREIRNLIVDGHTSPIRGFIDEDGKSYVGRVVLDDDFSPLVINVQKH